MRIAHSPPWNRPIGAYSRKGRTLRMLYTSVTMSLSATRTVPLSFTFVIGYGPRKATFRYLADQSFLMRTVSPILYVWGFLLAFFRLLF